MKGNSHKSESSQTAVSVIICTHNPRPDYLTRTLAALESQTVPREKWELLLIDNASDSPLSCRWELPWHPQGRHIREEQLGLTPARLRGIHEARGNLLIFVDDDNVLDSDYLQQALIVSERYLMIGAWSGNLEPCFETEPPSWTRTIWNSLAIREVVRDQWSNLPWLTDTMPWGAGLCVRREVAHFYSNLHQKGCRAIMLDRSGDSLVSGGDIDLASCACDLGLCVGLFRALRLTHLIPAFRLDEAYLLKLMEGTAYSSFLLSMLRPRVSVSFEPGEISPLRRKMSRIIRTARLITMNDRQRRFHKAMRRGEERAIRSLSEFPMANSSEELGSFPEKILQAEK